MPPTSWRRHNCTCPVFLACLPISYSVTTPVLLFKWTLQMPTTATKPRITFIEQNAPVDEYGRALYAVARSVIRALLDSLTDEDLTDLNCSAGDVTLRQLAKVIRLERDKGMRGDGFEWAVHEAITGKEPMVIDPLATAIKKASPKMGSVDPTSLLFGYERAKYLGFLKAVVQSAGYDPVLLPEGSGRPFQFGPWVALAANGKAAEPQLNERIKQIWKTDLFVGGEGMEKYMAATVKSNYKLLEPGRGLRIGIVPESTSTAHRAGVQYSDKYKLWLVTLPDPNGFTGLFNDAYHSVARAICTVGKQEPPDYYAKPSAKGQKVQEQLERYPGVKVIEIEGALNEAAQQNLVNSQTKLLGVNAPSWLHMKQISARIIAPKPSFVSL